VGMAIETTDGGDPDVDGGGLEETNCAGWEEMGHPVIPA